MMKKNTANPPTTVRMGGRPARSAGRRSTQIAVTRTVSTSTAMIETSDAVKTARPIATRSINSTQGQSNQESVVPLNSGTMTSTSAIGGNRWPHQIGAAPARTRSSTTGKTECKAANSKYALKAQFNRSWLRYIIVQTLRARNTTAPLARCARAKSCRTSVKASKHKSAPSRKLKMTPGRAPSAA